MWKVSRSSTQYNIVYWMRRSFWSVSAFDFGQIEKRWNVQLEPWWDWIVIFFFIIEVRKRPRTIRSIPRTPIISVEKLSGFLILSSSEFSRKIVYSLSGCFSALQDVNNEFRLLQTRYLSLVISHFRRVFTAFGFWFGGFIVLLGVQSSCNEKTTKAIDRNNKVFPLKETLDCPIHIPGEHK